jgi:formylglycine-generating enzyme required for sulfatase activity
MILTMLLCWALVVHAAPQERISPRDGAVQVLVPGGEFIMGADDPQAPLADEQRPPHPVTLSPFWMDKYEVTNEQFARFLNELLATEGKQWTDRQCFEGIHWRVMIEHPLCGLEFDLAQRLVTVKKGKDNFPVMPVRWAAAAEYAAKVGRRLPTEAEWEYAARGTDGRRYPWGNDWNPKWANVQSKGIVAVDAMPTDRSPFGIIGMAGNVREWVQDFFSMDFYAASPKDNPVNTGNSPERVMRGGSYMFTEWDARTTSRYCGIIHDGISPAVGFRTVERADPGK